MNDVVFFMWFFGVIFFVRYVWAIYMLLKILYLDIEENHA